MDETDLLRRLGVALAIGLLVGLERGWHTREEPDSMRPAGLRTFALTGLLGGIAGALSLKLGGVVLAASFATLSAGFIAFHWLEAQKEGDLGATTVVAGMLTFLLGSYALVGEVTNAVIAGVSMTILLASRQRLHTMVASLTPEEIRAILTLVAMSFLLLPLLPNRPVDPWGAINPYLIWLMAITIALVSFGGYVAVKVFGQERGVLLTAVAGGLASSTAVTLSFARLAREHPQSERLLASGILASGATMMVRVAVLAGVLNAKLITPLALPLGAAALVMLFGGWLLLGGARDDEQPRLDVTNPLELGTALKLAGLILIIMLAGKLMKAQFGDAGVMALAAVSGIADVDAITLSMAQSGGKDLTLAVAAAAILLAVAVNSLAKVGLAGWEGGTRLGFKTGTVSLLAIAVAGAVAYFL
ncbi:MAG TPA: MgtC/SapB family protein [Beijerinckiaceae bacterium]|nr:MgtC/SapB family protein [Beijerinckiaceae bacterium]